MCLPDLRASLVVSVSAALAAAVLAAPAAAAAPAAPAGFSPVLLAGPGLATSAVDISPTGVIVGTSGSAEQYPTQPSPDARPVRWLPRADGGHRRQLLPLPDGATGADVAGVTNGGAVGGTLFLAGEFYSTRAARWPASGRAPSLLAGDVGSRVSAVGPAQVLVDIPPTSGFGGDLELVRADGSRVDIDAVVGPQPIAREAYGKAVGGRDAAVFSLLGGAGQGSTLTHFVYAGGAVTPLPVQSGFLFGQACLTRQLPDGTVAYEGPSPAQQRSFAGIHRGGVPGTETDLPTPEGAIAQLPCYSGDVATDAIHSDGTVVGSLYYAGFGEVGAMWQDGVLTQIPTLPGEWGVQAVAVASGGRAVIVATVADGSRQPFLWRDGVRQSLTLPAGWTLRDVVEMTDAGVVLANVTKPDGSVRPVVWRTA
jgi:hypothetical protein